MEQMSRTSPVVGALNKKDTWHYKLAYNFMGAFLIWGALLSAVAFPLMAYGLISNSFIAIHTVIHEQQRSN